MTERIKTAIGIAKTRLLQRGHLKECWCAQCMSDKTLLSASQELIELKGQMERIEGSGVLPEKQLYPDSIADTKLGFKKRGFNEAIDKCCLRLAKNWTVERIKETLKGVYDLRNLSGMDRGIIAQAIIKSIGGKDV